MSSCEQFIQAGGFSKANNLDLFLDCVRESSNLGPGHRGAGGLLVVAILFFAVVHRAYKQAMISGGPNGSPLRAVWVWDNLGIPQKSGKFLATQVFKDPGPYLAWAEERGIFQTWIDPINVLNKPDVVSKFLSLSKAQGMSTQFLFASRVQLGDDPKASGLNDLTQIFELLEQIDQSLWPTAFQSDIEAGVVPGSSAYPLFAAHVKFKEKIDSMNQKFGSQIGAVASVGPWWTSYNDMGEDPPKVANKDYGNALLEKGWDVTVQDYRKPIDWVTKTAKAWCELATYFERTAWIGTLIGPLDENAIDYQANINQLDPDLTHVAKTCVDEPGFGGMAVHDSYFYQKVAP